MYLRGNCIGHRVNARPLDNGITSVSASFLKNTHCYIRHDILTSEELGVDAKQFTCALGIVESNEKLNVIEV